MAFTTGTATGYQDLLAKFLTFIQTNSSLVGASQNWTLVRTESSGGESDVLLRGPGLAAADQIYVRLASVNSGANVGLSCWGFVSYNSTLNNASQPGISASVGIPLSTGSISYWFIANGRRFIIIAKVSSYFYSMYAGFTLPYSDPDEQPYPMFIGASAPSGTAYSNTTTTYDVGAFWNPSNLSAYVRDPTGTWVEIQNVSGSSQSYSTNAVWPWSGNYGLVVNPSSGAAEWPAIVFTTNYLIGALEGVFGSLVPTIATEDTTTISSATRIVIPSVYRSDIYSFASIRLE